MTTYSAAAITNTVLDYLKGVTISILRTLRDNPLAMFEGSAGAPRLQFAALGSVTAGATARSRASSGVTTNTANVNAEAYAFGTLQTGTVRLSCQHRSSAGQTVTLTFKRWRIGVVTTLVTYTTNSVTYVARTLDISVLPGDTVSVDHIGASTDYSHIQNLIISTGGEILWPFPVRTSVE